MALLGFVCVAFSYGAVTGSLPLIYGQAIDEFSWSHTQGVLIFSCKNISSALVSLFIAGPLIEHFGLKAVLAGAGVILFCGAAAFLFVDGMTSYYLTGFVIGAGVMPIMIVCQTLVSRWFTNNQGLAVAIVVMGVSAGGVIFPLIVSFLIEAIGWRAAIASLGIGVVLIVIPAFLAFADVNPSSADIMAEAKGDGGGRGLAQTFQSADLPHEFSDLLRTGGFWMAVISLTLVSAADSAVLQHTYLFLDREMQTSAPFAASILSLTFGLGFIAKVAAGKIFDWFSIAGMTAWYILLAFSIGLAFTTSSGPFLIAFAIVRGFAHGGFVIIAPVMAKHCYGPRLMNRALPIFMGAFAIGNAGGPPALSLLRDTMGGYSLGFLLCISACLLSAVMLAFVKPDYRIRLQTQRLA